MSAVQPVITALLTAPAVAAVVGNRIFPGVAPQDGALPDLIVSQSSAREESMLFGSSSYPEARVTVICRAARFADCDGLGDRVVEALRSYVLRQGAREVLVSRDLVDSTDFTSDRGGYHRRIVGFVVRHR